MNERFCDAYAICTSHDDKKVDVFKVKDLKIVMCSNGVQFQSNELAPSGTISNIVHKLRINIKIFVMTIETNNCSSNNRMLIIDSHKCSHPTH
jgi:hypothetical protein